MPQIVDVTGATVTLFRECRLAQGRFDYRADLRLDNEKGAAWMITISAFKWVPDFAQGQVRDLRARWALEEAGLPYRTRLLEQGEQDQPDYRALQPFGQVPVLEEDGFVLFESGAIVLYIGERSETLLPKDAAARARATQWLVAALNSIEPFVMNVALIDLFYAHEEWAKLRRPGAVTVVQKRLSAVSNSLGDKPYLDGDRFTAGDLMMTTVLRILRYTDIVSSDARLAAYVERCTARPAFKRALDAQMRDFQRAA
jgi:glutathione S-transferase